MAYITKKTTIDGVKPIGSNLFGTCSTASGTAQKVVTMADFNVLVEGVTIHVYFDNENTASNPTLKVGSTSAIAISCNGVAEGKWENGAVISFTYDGVNWIQNDASEGGGGQEYPYVSDVEYDSTSNFMAFGVTRERDQHTTSVYTVTVRGVGKIERDGDDLKVYNYAPTGHNSSTRNVQTISLVPSGLIDMFYPVGSYYETSDTTFDPNVTWGGTWSLETEGQVHISAGANYTVAGALTDTTDGGETEHKLTTNEIPSHNHGSSGAHTHTLNLRNAGTSGSRATNNVTYGASGHDYQNDNPFPASNGAHTHTSVGGNGAHNNMQPYIIVNRWHRTA